MLSRAIRWCRGRRARFAGDRGITLAELVVSMSLTTVLGTMAVLFFVGATHEGYRTVFSNQNTSDARITLDSWTNMLRVAGWLDPNTEADRFEEITPTKIVFYANLGNRVADTASAYSAPKPTTKVALMLRVSNASTGVGQLIEITYNSDNTTPQSVRQLGFSAKQTGSTPIFQPYSRAGSPLDLTTMGCASGSTAKAGLCLQSGQAGSGTLDPTVGATGLSVSSGPLRGNPLLKVDKVLNQVGSIGVSFTVLDSSNTSSMDFTSLASVSSGYPS